MATTDQQRTQARTTIQELTDRLRGRVVVRATGTTTRPAACGTG